MSYQQRLSMGEPVEEIIPVEFKVKSVRYNFDIANTTALKVAKYNLNAGNKVVHKKFGKTSELM